MVPQHEVEVLPCQLLLVLEARLPEHRLHHLSQLGLGQAVVGDLDEGPGQGEGGETNAACHPARSGSGRCWVGSAPAYLMWLPVTQEMALKRYSSSLPLTLSWVGWPRAQKAEQNSK